MRHLTIRPGCGSDWWFWSSKWLWTIIFSVRVIIQYMHVTCSIWHMTERLPSHNFDWFALLEIGFVPADIWISWFGPFAFVKPSLSHLRVLELECWISPETSFVFSISNYPHLYLVQRHLNNKTNCTLHMFNFHLKKIFWDIQLCIDFMANGKLYDLLDTEGWLHRRIEHEHCNFCPA